MRIDILTLFPEMFAGVISTSILKRPRKKNSSRITCTSCGTTRPTRTRKSMTARLAVAREWSSCASPSSTPSPKIEAMDDQPATRVLLAPTGGKLTQKMAEELSTRPRLLLITGHYEGFDERIHELLKPREISIGDFILSGGELPAMVLLDAVVPVDPRRPGPR